LASKRRIRKKACDGKVKYKTVKDAQSARINMKRFKGENLTVYKCKFCRNYHVGHKKGEPYKWNYVQ